MRDILTLPQDVHAFIWSNLDLPDVLHLRQTCSVLSRAISNDKQLWSEIFNRDVKAQSLAVPYNLYSLVDATAHETEALIKHAVVLERKYINPGKLSFRRIGNGHGLGVTWLKLLRGRWCLIASSNTEQSKFSVWEILPNGELRLAGGVYLEGPVIDGVVDESAEYVHCALTIGTSEPYILIFAIFSSRGEVKVRLLEELLGASYVRFLDERYLGFAVQNGDDTYPYIADWRTSSNHMLMLPNTDLPSPLPLEPCITMTVKNGYVLTLHRSAIHIFAFTAAEYQPCTSHVVTLPLREKACSGYFLDVPAEEHGLNLFNIFVRLYYQAFGSELRRAIVLHHGNLGERLTFSLAEREIIDPHDVFESSSLARYCLGTSARRIFFMVSSSRCGYYPPSLYTEAIRSKEHSTDDIIACREYRPISRNGFPLSHVMSSLAFDDGNGLLLVGDISGGVRLASFVEEEFMARIGTRTDLPEILTELSTLESEKVSQVPIQPDLPSYYIARKRNESKNNLSTDLRQRVIQSWIDPLLRSLSFSNWSNDWSQFGYVYDWITPYSRWGTSDQDFFDTPTSTARVRLQSLGEIIPVIYDMQNHKQVVFRIGQRMFYCRSRKFIDDDEEDDFDAENDENVDFMDEMNIILGVLPCTYDEFCSDPVSILVHVSDRSTQRNLGTWAIPQCNYAQNTAAWTVRRIRSYQKSHGMEVTDYTTMEQWSNEEWDRKSDMADDF